MKRILTFAPLLALFILAYFIAWQELIMMVRIVLYTIVILTILAAIGIILVSIEKFKELRASRKKVELESCLINTKEDTWIREEIKRDGQKIIEYARLGGPRLRVNSHDHNPTQSELLYANMLSKAPRQIPQPQEVVIEQKQDLIKILNQARYGIIVGAQDAGKTTILKHLITTRLHTSHILIIDPHSSPNKWPADCKVIGSGRNFEQINNALNSLMLLMSQRYREIAKGEQGEEGHERITVILDEWMPITEQIGKEAEQVIRSLLSESRKVNIHMFLGSHSERVGPLGIKGAGDLKKGLVMVRLNVNPLTKNRNCTVDWGEGEIEAELPGPYERKLKDNFLLPEAIPERAKLILDCYDNGVINPTDICERVHGYKAGKYTKEISEIIRRYR